MKLTGWWKNRSSAGKVELYTRWSFHFFVLIEIFSIGLPALGSMAKNTSPVLGVSLFLTVCAHSVVVGVLSSRALDWIAGGASAPYGSRPSPSPSPRPRASPSSPYGRPCGPWTRRWPRPCSSA